MNVQEILIKCRKLSRLSTSSNPNEAALAASRLAEIMIKYQISEAEVYNNEIHDIDHKVDSHFFYSSNRKSHWRMSIAGGCARLFNCIPYWFHGTGTIHLIGREDDVNLCRYLYESITVQVESLCQSEWAKYWLETCLLEDDDQEETPESNPNSLGTSCICLLGFDPECPWSGHRDAQGHLRTAPASSQSCQEPLEHKRSWSQSFYLSCSAVVKSRLLQKHKAMMSSLPSDSQALIVFKDRYKDSLVYAKSMKWSKSKSVPSASSINGYISGQISGSKVRIDKEISSNLPLLKGASK